CDTERPARCEAGLGTQRSALGTRQFRWPMSDGRAPSPQPSLAPHRLEAHHRRMAELGRVRMPDGRWWTVERRHEMTQLLRRGRERERRLFLFFTNDRGATRRAHVPDDFPADA